MVYTFWIKENKLLEFLIKTNLEIQFSTYVGISYISPEHFEFEDLDNDVPAQVVVDARELMNSGKIEILAKNRTLVAKFKNQESLDIYKISWDT